FFPFLDKFSFKEDYKDKSTLYNKNVINQDDKHRAVNNHDVALLNDYNAYNSSLYQNVQDINHFVNTHGSHYSEFQMDIVSQGSSYYYPIELFWYLLLTNAYIRVKILVNSVK
ncbi:15729_t:CDS:2, partial [Racocetra fulgida]